MEDDDTGRLKEMSTEELKQEAIHSTLSPPSLPGNYVFLPGWLAWATLAGIAVIILLATVFTYMRWDKAANLEAENLTLHLRIKDMEKDLQQLAVEREREAQLLRIAATQEAEGSVLTKLARKTPQHRDKVDQIKAETRRYLLLNANFQASAKPPSQIVAELCRIYLDTSYEGCY